MKRIVSKSLEELIAQAPKLSVYTGPSDPNAFKEKLEEGERILKIAGVPKRPKK